MVKTSQHQLCPCGEQHYKSCCAPYHKGAPTSDAKKLMRSRYSAYVLGLIDYIWQTWDELTRPTKESLLDTNPPHWLGLSIKNFSENGNTATVEFVARYKIDGRAHCLHEISRFIRYGEFWFYYNGTFPNSHEN